jgi:hypothetical protein
VQTAIVQCELSGGSVMLPQDFKYGFCWGAFSTVQRIITNSMDGKHMVYGVCAPANSSRTQLISIFVSYAEKNPGRLHEDFFFVALDSLRTSFPCKDEFVNNPKPQ